jgi:hypothetical protein
MATPHLSTSDLVTIAEEAGFGTLDPRSTLEHWPLARALPGGIV